MTRALPLNTNDYLRIYGLFEKAMDAEDAALAAHEPTPMELDLDDAIETVADLYGHDALRAILTGRSPRAI